MKSDCGKTSTFGQTRGQNGWVVGQLSPEELVYADAGYKTMIISTHATEEDAKRSIKENRADWLAYFGIKEWEECLISQNIGKIQPGGSRARSIFCAVAKTERLSTFRVPNETYTKSEPES